MSLGALLAHPIWLLGKDCYENSSHSNDCDLHRSTIGIRISGHRRVEAEECYSAMRRRQLLNREDQGGGAAAEHVTRSCRPRSNGDAVLALSVSMENNKLALITGASSGIGLELAKQFAQNAHDLILVADDRDGLEGAAVMLRELGGGRVDIIVDDLAELDAPRRVFDEVQVAGRPLDVLVNNAGVGVYGKFIDNNLEDELAMIELNAIAVVQLTKFFAREMVRRGCGRILMTASVASEMPTPWMAVYGATKAFVYDFAQGLREELRESGITVTALMPGPTDTNFFDRAHANESKILDEKLADPAIVAEAGFKALMRGDDKVVVPLKYKIQSKMTNVIPDKLIARQSRKKHEPKEDRDEQR